MPQPAPSIPEIEPLYHTFFTLADPPTPPGELYQNPNLDLESISIRLSDGTTHHFRGVRLGRGILPVHPSFHAEWPQLPIPRRRLLLFLFWNSTEKATRITDSYVEGYIPGVWAEVPPSDPPVTPVQGVVNP